MSQDQIEQIAAPPTPDPKFEAALQDLEQISSANPSTQDLPPLDMSNEAVDSFTETLTQWLERFFKPSRPVDSDSLLLFWQAFQIVGLILVIVIVVYVIYVVAKKLRGPAAEEGPETTGTPLIGDQKAISEYEAALRSGDLSRAMRLRWVLFLSRKKKPKSQTPYEVFTAPPEPQVDRQYEIMFSQRTVKQTDFDDAMKYLGTKEQDS